MEELKTFNTSLCYIIPYHITAKSMHQLNNTSKCLIYSAIPLNCTAHPTADPMACIRISMNEQKGQFLNNLIIRTASPNRKFPKDKYYLIIYH